MLGQHSREPLVLTTQTTTPPTLSTELELLDSAVSALHWQAAYDAAMQLPLVDLAAVGSLVGLAQCLTDQGAADAALNLLERIIDADVRDPLVYWQLVRALTALDRYEDAANALLLLQATSGS
jgi:tetratricopeptide (TPR) repeat protein